MDRRIHLKVKILSLAAEARIIRRLELKHKGKPEAGSLHSHRVHPVRREQRESLIAYAYIRGKRYCETERNVKHEPDWESVKKIVDRFGGYGRSKDLEAWRKIVCE